MSKRMRNMRNREEPLASGSHATHCSRSETRKNKVPASGPADPDQRVVAPVAVTISLTAIHSGCSRLTDLLTSYLCPAVDFHCASTIPPLTRRVVSLNGAGSELLIMVK